ncbi:MAG: exosortase family protein XrtF [Kordia sp.]|nr:MAG: exosortase family protein XrtF [Kordia sp.]
MKTLIKKNKPVITFLAIFLSSYILLSLLYHFFLNTVNSPDFFTKSVSEQVISLLNLIDYETNSITDTSKGTINLFMKERNIAFIAEGCNAISIMILFVSFVFSFTKRIKPTLLFVAIGLIIIHLANIFRIVILIICLHHYPEYSEYLHSYIFPAMIYGVVFLLWMFWVNSFKKVNPSDL